VSASPAGPGHRRAFVALGSNAPDARKRLETALAALEQGGEAVAAVSPPFLAPYETATGEATEANPAVLDAVVEVRTDRTPRALLDRLHALEAEAGRRRDGGGIRTLDADLLDFEGVASARDPVLPHPRVLERAFVLEPWTRIAPLRIVEGTDRPVFGHALSLRRRHPERFGRLSCEAPLAMPSRGGGPSVLADAAELASWRESGDGPVGVVPTMGALHPGHAALLRRARAECARVVATIFVNPLQFGPGEDLARYPRTLDSDLALLGALGVDAAFVPEAAALYPEDFATAVTVAGPAEGLEGAERPGHFAGVATVVLKLWNLTRPDRLYLGQKDAQQLAVVRRMARDLDLGGRIVPCPIVRAEDGLALSSRNGYLDASERARALALPRTLDDLALELLEADVGVEAAVARARARMQEAGLSVDYVEIVDPASMRPLSRSGDPVLAVAAARAGSTRLLDNRWVALPVDGGGA
jgi:pantoate--beta-alanine ligase